MHSCESLSTYPIHAERILTSTSALSLDTHHTLPIEYAQERKCGEEQSDGVGDEKSLGGEAEDGGEDGGGGVGAPNDGEG
jgi:hypothetical protein